MHRRLLAVLVKRDKCIFTDDFPFTLVLGHNRTPTTANHLACRSLHPDRHVRRDVTRIKPQRAARRHSQNNILIDALLVVGQPLGLHLYLLEIHNRLWRHAQYGARRQNRYNLPVLCSLQLLPLHKRHTLFDRTIPGRRRVGCLTIQPNDDGGA